MQKIMLKFLIPLTIVVAAGMLIVFYFHQQGAQQPKAVKGVLDLRGYQFSGNEPVGLDGEWQFLPDKLVNSNQFDAFESYFVKVPSLWNDYEIKGEKLPKYLSGTYRLKIKVNDSNKIYGIKTNNIRMSNTIYMNGKMIGKSGIAKEDASYVPNNFPYVTYFTPGKKEIELLIHVANYDYALGGGILGSIFLGDQESIGKLREKSLIYDWVTIAAFFTMFIYFLGTYLHAKISVDQLYFSLFCLATILYSASHGEKVIGNIFPSIPYGLFERIQSVSSILIGLFMLLYFFHALKPFARKKTVNILFIIGIILTGTALLPVQFNSYLQNIYSLYIFSVLIYIIIIQITAAMKRSIGAGYLIFSTITIFIYFIVGTMNVLTNLELYFLPPLFPFICLLMLSLFISHRFTDSFLKKEELSNALMRVDKMKDEFLAKTSHEFRTPLHGIIAITQSMLDKDEPAVTTEQKEKASMIIGIAKRLSHLVNDILDFSKLKEGELKLVIVPVDLFAVTLVVVETFTYIIDKDVKIENHIKRGQFVLGDEERLRQILYNLIDNAVKYTNHGKIEIFSHEHKDHLTIEVRDTGSGIPPENIATLFEPFQQFEHSIGGIGLGLSVTKELVNLQGGEITVQSVLGEGTTFSITLPKAPSIDSPERQMNSVYDKQGLSVHLSLPYVLENKGKKKIIIVDDDHVNLKVLIDTLMNEDYFIIAIDNGKAVFEQLGRHPDVDLVILDIMMPGMSGYEVCQQLRKSYSPADLPVLMLTAAIRPEDMIAAFQSGANDFLHKPLDSSELKTRIRNLLLMKESAEIATKMEVAFLQAQIKPHFIYNVLNSILSLSYLDLDKARLMITDFANFLRGSFSFENTNKLVPLEKELSLIQSYINIHCTRFPDQLEWEVIFEDSINGLIPPLILQPLIENAILHGLKGKDRDGKVKLVIKKEDNMAIFQITDNGKGIPENRLKQILNEDQRLEQGVGILNIAKRLRYYEKASIHIESQENRGTTVVIRFPLFIDKKVVTPVAQNSISG